MQEATKFDKIAAGTPGSRKYEVIKMMHWFLTSVPGACQNPGLMKDLWSTLVWDNLGL